MGRCQGFLCSIEMIFLGDSFLPLLFCLFDCLVALNVLTFGDCDSLCFLLASFFEVF